MTRKQEHLYFVLWRKACEANNWPSNDDARRHGVHVQALGFDVSHRHFTDQQFDRIIHLLKLLANPDNLDSVLFFQDPERGERNRLLWRIERTAPKRYIESISADKFGTVYYRDLTATQLEQLRNTLTNRMRTKRKKALAAEPIEVATSFIECPF